MLKTWLERTISPCWCHFIQALVDVRLYELAKEVQKHFKANKSASVTSPDTCEGNVFKSNENVHLEKSCKYSSALPSNGKDLCEDSAHREDENSKLSLEELKMYLNDLPQDRLKFFASKFLPNDVIKAIRQSAKVTIDNICMAFLKDPMASWLKVHDGLKQAGCNKLAETIDACFL